MRETALVEAIRKLAAEQRRNRAVVKGIGDDCAIVRAGAKEDLVFTSDFVLEGRHFERATHTAADVGHKALARSLSDLAAMGSEPVFCLVSLAVPAELASRWVQDFYRSFLGLAARSEITLAGGDLAQFEKVVVDVTCCGRVPQGKAMLRNGAKPGDAIYVTGELGASALGFRTRRGAAWRRHKRPEPRIEAGVALRRSGVSSCMDLSDGLALDLSRLCRESNVSADVMDGLPVARGATLDDALYGGEDYELLFAARPTMKIPRLAASLPVTRIGTIVRGKAGLVQMNGQPLEPKGFDHFAD